VVVHSGSHDAFEYLYLYDGTVTGKEYNNDKQKTGVITVSTNNSSVIYSFDTRGICNVNGAISDCWFGPKR